jgi:hypothetical protein
MKIFLFLFYILFHEYSVNNIFIMLLSCYYHDKNNEFLNIICEIDDPSVIHFEYYLMIDLKIITLNI